MKENLASDCSVFNFDFFFFFVVSSCGMWDLSSPNRDWTGCCAGEVRSLNHWTTPEGPCSAVRGYYKSLSVPPSLPSFSFLPFFFPFIFMNISFIQDLLCTVFYSAAWEIQIHMVPNEIYHLLNAYHIPGIVQISLYMSTVSLEGRYEYYPHL